VRQDPNGTQVLFDNINTPIAENISAHLNKRYRLFQMLNFGVREVIFSPLETSFSFYEAPIIRRMSQILKNDYTTHSL
jgi:hypothetical protein